MLDGSTCTRNDAHGPVIVRGAKIREDLPEVANKVAVVLVVARIEVLAMDQGHLGTPDLLGELGELHGEDLDSSNDEYDGDLVGDFW